MSQVIVNAPIMLDETGQDIVTALQGIGALVGPNGPAGPQGPQGNAGEAGVGIVSVTKAATVGIVDTYNVNYSNGAFDVFTVTNGDIPTVNASVAGMALLVDSEGNGIEWGAFDAFPEYTVANAGQVLTVNNVGNGVEWAIGTGASYIAGNAIDITQNVISVNAAELTSKQDVMTPDIDYIVPPNYITGNGSITVTVANNTEYNYTDVTALDLTGNSVNCHGFITFNASTPTITCNGFNGLAGDDITLAQASETWEFSCSEGYAIFKNWSS